MGDCGGREREKRAGRNWPKQHDGFAARVTSLLLGDTNGQSG